MIGHYKLDGHMVVQVHDLYEWAEWFETADRKVKSTITGSAWVSTVFVGLDMSYGEGGPPLFFETMVFPNPAEGEEQSFRGLESYRWTNWYAAEEGHDGVVAEILDLESEGLFNSVYGDNDNE